MIAVVDALTKMKRKITFTRNNAVAAENGKQLMETGVIVIVTNQCMVGDRLSNMTHVQSGSKEAGESAI